MKVLDTSGILHSDLDFSSCDYVITNSVLQELHDENSRLMVEHGIRNGYIKVREPKVEIIEKVKKTARETGDLYKLSNADIDVIALALENKAVVISDDYSIQNLAKILNLRYQTTAQEGIKKNYKWEKVCGACGLKHSAEFKTCEVCGSKLRLVGKSFHEE